MGFLWEGYQQISNNRTDSSQDMRADSLEQRVAWIEQVLYQQNELLGSLIRHLEVRFGEDLNGDQRIG